MRRKGGPASFSFCSDAAVTEILLVTHSLGRGGAERMAAGTGAYLFSRGYNVDFVAPPGPLLAEITELGPRWPGTPVVPVSWPEGAGRWLLSLLRATLDVPRLMALMWRRRVRLVITNTTTTPAAVMAGTLLRIPVVLFVREHPQGQLGAATIWAQARLASMVVIVAPEARHHLPGRGEKAVLIRDGVPLERLSFRPANPPSDTPRLLLVGRLDDRKGQDVAIAGVDELRRAGVRATLSLAGEHRTPSGAAARRQVAHLGLTDQVSFLGSRPDVSALLKEHDILLAPSSVEWTPLVVLEAMATGTPVIASAVGNLPQLLADGAAGRLVPAPVRPSALAQAVVDVLNHPEETRDAVAEARARVEELGSEQASHEALEGMLVEFLKGGRSR